MLGQQAQVIGTGAVEVLLGLNILGALLDAKGAPDTDPITSQDAEAICSLTRKIDGFKIWPGLAEVARYPRFTIAIVAGSVDAPNSFKNPMYVHAYFVRVPNHGWYFLEARPTVKPAVRVLVKESHGQNAEQPRRSEPRDNAFLPAKSQRREVAGREHSQL